MTRRSDRITLAEFAAAFSEACGVPAVLNVQQLAALLQISTKTVYEWHAKGRFGTAARKRGKHLFFWRDRALDVIFNGSEWK